MAPPAIEFEGVARRFDNYTAVEDISFAVAPGSFTALVGPSGCGKSTILNMAAGLLSPTSGAIRVAGEALTGINRRSTYMFQQEALLPWKSVTENIALGLAFRGVPPEVSGPRAAEWLRRAGLQGFGDHYPHQLSGGMRKRAAMAQCWIVDPAIVLMDEPFGALDIHTRQRMEGEVLDTWAATRNTILFITHDLEEAVSLADEVLVLSAGPASRIVARYAIDLPRPRNLIDIRTEPRFHEIYGDIWRVLRQQVIQSHEATR